MKAAMKLMSVVLLAALASGAASCARGRDVARHSPKIDALRASVPDKGRKEALDKVARLYEEASFHQESLEDIAEIIALSGRNLDAVSYAAELVSSVGFHTVAIVDVAARASEAELELPEFRDLVELAVLRSGGHDALLALADRAARARSGEEAAALRSEIAAMRDAAEWKTVGEAVAAVEDQQADIGRAIRGRLRMIK